MTTWSNCTLDAQGRASLFHHIFGELNLTVLWWRCEHAEGDSGDSQLGASSLKCSGDYWEISESASPRLSLTVCDPHGLWSSGSSVHGILRAKKLE